MLNGKCVVLGVTGGIAAYKAAYLASALVKQHCDVQVIMTANATQFVTPLTFEQLTGNKCLTDTFDRNFVHQVEHIAVADRTDLADQTLGENAEKRTRNQKVFNSHIQQTGDSSDGIVGVQSA